MGKDKKGICKICKSEISANQGNTSTMKRHANKPGDHLKRWNEINEEFKAENMPSKVQQKFFDCLEKQAKYPLDSEKRKKLNRELLGLITQDLQPLSIVEDPGFKSYTKALDPKYTLPSRKYIRTELLPTIYEEEVEEIKAELKKSDHVAITSK